MAYILDTFPIVKRKDEKKWGDYRTKRVILEIYDALTEAMRANSEWQVENGEVSAKPQNSTSAFPYRPAL